MIPCGHKLADTGRTVEVPGLCCGQQVQAVHRCVIKGECIDLGVLPGLHACATCEVSQRPATFPTVKPVVYKKIQFKAGAGDHGAYNCSLHGDEKAGFAFVFRSGWTRSNIRACRLSETYQPQGVMMPLSLLHPRSPRGKEDARLFRFRGKWHISFTGYEASDIFCTVLVAEIDPWPDVQSVWVPEYSGRIKQEKNWVFFEHAGELFCVYKVGSPHRVFHVSGRKLGQEFSVDWKQPEGFGELRGGASPVLHNGEWYHWFHTFYRGRQTVYSAGLYTFEDKPPFRPLRAIKTPIAVGGLSQISKEGFRKSVYYPCGAAIKNGRWHISAGEHDSGCTVAAFDAKEIEKELKPWE